MKLAYENGCLGPKFSIHAAKYVQNAWIWEINLYLFEMAMQLFSPAEINVIVEKDNLPHLSKYKQLNARMLLCQCVSHSVILWPLWDITPSLWAETEWTGHFLRQTNCPLLSYNSHARVWLMLQKESNLHFPPPFFCIMKQWVCCQSVSHSTSEAKDSVRERQINMSPKEFVCESCAFVCVFVIVRVRRRWWSEASLFALLIQSSKEWADVTPTQGQRQCGETPSTVAPVKQVNMCGQ